MNRFDPPLAIQLLLFPFVVLDELVTRDSIENARHALSQSAMRRESHGSALERTPDKPWIAALAERHRRATG